MNKRVKNKWVMVITSIIFLVLFFTTPGIAVDNFTGEWEGAIEIPGSPLEIIVQFQFEDDELIGSMDIPAQGAYGINLIINSVDSKNIEFLLEGLPGDPAVKAEISDDGSLISGDFMQAGMTFPIELRPEGLKEVEFNISSLNDFDIFIEAVRNDWNTPGIAVGIVTDREILFADGFGYLDVEKTQPVTSETLFGIGSTTKPFTTMILGMLVDEGKLNWDEPIRNYIDFRLDDDPLSDYITVKDLVSHRSGLPRYDFTLIFNQDLTREGILENIGYMERNQDFRNSFQYGNYSYILAGLVIEEITGMSWEEAVQEKVFKPLDMNISNLSINELKETENFALPYVSEDRFETLTKIDFWELGAAAPAGSINSNVDEMNKWMQVYLNNGRIGNEQLISGASINSFFNSANNISSRGMDSYTDHYGYGLGWFINSYRGNFRVNHDGVTMGFSAGINLIPDKNIGIVVLSNLHGSPVTQIIANEAIDRLLDLEPVQWKDDYLELLAQQPVDFTMSLFDRDKRRESTPPSHALEELTGEYNHPLYGTFSVFIDDDRLIADYHGTELEMEHWHYNVFTGHVDIAGPMEIAMEFKSDLDGQINQLDVGLDVFMTQDMIRFDR